jgi:hypothetical protein
MTTEFNFGGPTGHDGTGRPAFRSKVDYEGTLGSGSRLE